MTATATTTVFYSLMNVKHWAANENNRETRVCHAGGKKRHVGLLSGENELLCVRRAKKFWIPARRFSFTTTKE